MKVTTKRQYWLRYQSGLVDLWLGPYNTISDAHKATDDPNVREAVNALHDDTLGPIGWSIIDGMGTRTEVKQ